MYATGCIDCHGDDLTGMPPVVSALRAEPDNHVSSWSEKTLLTCSAPVKTNRPMVSYDMPWYEYNAALSDEELKDMYTYLHGLEEKLTNP